jgi:hypothetical protein
VLIAHDISRALDPVLFAQDVGITCDPWQAALLRERPRRALLNCSRQSGKSTVTGVGALHVAIHEPGELVVLLAPSQRQSGELLRSVMLMHSKLDGAPPLVGDSVLKIELENGSRIVALPGNDDDGRTIRGLARVRLLVVDEAARVSDGLLSAIRPMLAVHPDAAFILLSTPAGKRGQFYELWHNGDSAWVRIRVSADQCPRISKEFLAEELRELGPARFSEEYELAFIDSDTAAFNSSIIDAAFDPEVLPLWR